MIEPMGWAAAHLLKKRQTNFEMPQGISRSIHRLMAGLMILDGFLLPGWVPGMSALACFGLKASGSCKYIHPLVPKLELGNQRICFCAFCPPGHSLLEEGAFS